MTKNFGALWLRCPAALPRRIGMAYAHVVSVRDFDEGNRMAANSVGPPAPLRALIDSFWIYRVGIFSVLSGWLILDGASQAQSLFLDMHTSEVGLWHLDGLLWRRIPVLDAVDPAQHVEGNAMYGFLILLPLTLISLLIGSLIATSTQVADYVAYITDISRQDVLTQQIWADRRIWMQIGSHVAGYVVLCFTLIATVRTISAPLPADRPAGLRYFQLLLEVMFVAVPSVVLLWINGHALMATREIGSTGRWSWCSASA